MSADEQQRLFENTARAMTGVDEHIKWRHVCNCYRADPAYGMGVATALGLDMSQCPHHG
ncbi:catalase-related domain-containing protein [Plesiomonas shigelloides]